MSRIYKASGWSRGRARIKEKVLHLKGFLMVRVRRVGLAALDLHDSASLNRAFMQWKFMIQEREVAQKQNADSRHEQLAATTCREACGEFVPDNQCARLKRRFVLREILHGAMKGERCQRGTKVKL